MGVGWSLSYLRPLSPSSPNRTAHLQHRLRGHRVFARSGSQTEQSSRHEQLASPVKDETYVCMRRFKWLVYIFLCLRRPRHVQQRVSVDSNRAASCVFGGRAPLPHSYIVISSRSTRIRARPSLSCFLSPARFLETPHRPVPPPTRRRTYLRPPGHRQLPRSQLKLPTWGAFPVRRTRQSRPGKEGERRNGKGKTQQTRNTKLRCPFPPPPYRCVSLSTALPLLYLIISSYFLFAPRFYF